jgi:uncharacterized caspase-like protein
MLFRSVTLFAFLLFLIADPAHAEKRVALVIGNAAYKNAVTLQNPRNDAQDVSAALQRLGFETIVGLDLDRDGMEEKSIAFSRAARDADVALVYYSGHAMQFGGFNYLMPVDAALHDEADLRRLTRVDEIVAHLKQAKNLRILVLDACRDSPLADELSRSMEASRGLTLDRGLARIIPPSGMIISYATQAGRTAADGRGRNSPYTMAFLKNIDTTEEIGAVFRNITSDVYAATESKQLPELSLSLIGNYYLKGRPEAATGAPPTAPLAQPTSEAAQAWAAIQGTTSQAVLEDYIKHYGDSFYGALARARLDELKKSQVAVVAPPVTAPSAAARREEPASPALGTYINYLTLFGDVFERIRLDRDRIGKGDTGLAFELSLAKSAIDATLVEFPSDGVRAFANQRQAEIASSHKKGSAALYEVLNLVGDVFDRIRSEKDPQGPTNKALLNRRVIQAAIDGMLKFAPLSGDTVDRMKEGPSYKKFVDIVSEQGRTRLLLK